MQRFFFQLYLLWAVLLTAGCGIKGDLYPPEDAEEKFTLSETDTGKH